MVGTPRTASYRAPASIARSQDEAKITVHGDAVTVSLGRRKFERELDRAGDAKRLAGGLSLMTLNQSLLWRAGFRPTDLKPAGRGAGRARARSTGRR